MNPVQAILVGAVRFYRWVLSPAKSVLFGPLGRCRFSPTCSDYALEAFQVHGAVKGSWLTVRRIGRCHPWGGCGHDPVPAPGSSNTPKRHGAPTGGSPRATMPQTATSHL